MTRRTFGSLVLLILATVFADSVISAGFWTPLPTLAAPRSLHGVAVVDGIVYAVGGSHGICFRPDCYATAAAAFDPRTGVWSSRAATTARKNHATAAAGGDIYVVGGDDDFNYFNSVQVYRPALDIWESRASMPTARSQIAAAEANGILYAIGGKLAGAGNTAANQNEAYDPVTNTWSVRAPMPTARYHLSVVSLEGFVYAIGGSLTSGEVVSTVEVYDPIANTWSTRAPLPMPITGAATVAGTDLSPAV